MLRHETTNHQLKTVSYSTDQPLSDDEIALPADLFNILEDIPFNFDELANENIDYNHLPLFENNSDYEQIRAISRLAATDQLETPTFEEMPPPSSSSSSSSVAHLLPIVEDNIIMDFEEEVSKELPNDSYCILMNPINSESSSPSMSPQPPTSLNLDLTIQPTIGADLTTPLLIKMLLDEEQDTLTKVFITFKVKLTSE